MADHCPHRRRQVYRRPFSGSFHLIEWCLDCNRNARGAGVWVPRSEVPDPDAMPVFPGLEAFTPEGSRQRGLFEEP